MMFSAKNTVLLICLAALIALGLHGINSEQADLAAQFATAVPPTNPSHNFSSKPPSTRQAESLDVSSPPTSGDTGFSARSQAQHASITSTELLNEIAWIVANGAPGDQEHVEDLLDELSQRGLETTSAIRNFLLGNSRRGMPGQSESVNEGLRMLVLRLLLDMDTPGVEHIALELMESQPPISELWLLGRYLESNQPGKYSNFIRHYAQEALNSAEADAPIPGGFFQLLGKVGDSSTTPLLTQMPIHRDAYASVALAMIPDGSGLPILEHDARLVEYGEPTLQSRLAIELLASQAHQHALAGQVLIDLAEKQLIPLDDWPHILALVSGRWVITLDPPLSGRMDTHTIFRPEGNQVIYRVVRSSPLHDENYYNTENQGLLSYLISLAPDRVGFWR